MTDRSADRTDGGAPGGATDGPRIAERRDPANTRAAILAAARSALLEEGFGRLSTRRVAEMAGVPLSQIHYHFGSKQRLVLAVLAAQNERLLERQAEMFAGPEPLWRRWERACDFLDADLQSGYVRVLQEMIAAGWSDPDLAGLVRQQLAGWFGLLADVARSEAVDGTLGPFTPEEVGALMGLPFVGAEPLLLLGFSESELPIRSALRKVGALVRRLDLEPVAATGDGR